MPRSSARRSLAPLAALEADAELAPRPRSRLDRRGAAWGRRALSMLCASLVLTSVAPRSHAESKAEPPGDGDKQQPSRASAVNYAALDSKSCIEALEQRKIVFSIEKEAPGVLIPVRLLGPLHGVTWRTDFAEEQRRTTPYEVLDCRLLLAIDDFSAILEQHEVQEVRIFSFWRPPPKSWPKGKIAKRHPGGLAADVRLFKKRPPAPQAEEERAPKGDASDEKRQAKRSSPKKKSPRKSKATRRKGSAEDELSVLEDFGGKVGGKACGKHASAPRPDTAKARELREIVCDAARQRLFNSILTPHFDKHHFNHFHLEVTAGVKWFIVD